MNNCFKMLTYFKCGWAEFFLAMIPLLNPYSKGIISLGLLACLIVAIICFFRRQEKWHPQYYRIFVAYIIIHELVLCFTMPSFEMYHVNNLIQTIICMVTIIIAAPAIDVEKFTHAIYIIGAIVSLGILYQFLMLLSGNPIQPLSIPFFDILFERARGDKIAIRPMSFFDEPAAFANYMIIPMFFLLKAKKYVWYGVSVFFVLLSTSTTGVVSSIALLVFNAMLNVKHKGQIIVIAILLGGVFYGINNIEVLSATKEKIEDTDVEKNGRMMNGPYMFQHLEPVEYVVGINASNIFDYVQNHKELYKGLICFPDSNMFYVSNFWTIFIKFGIIGFVIYNLIYILLIKKDIKLLPLLGTELAFSVFGGLGISTPFVFVITAAIASSLYDREMSLSRT